MNKQNLAILVFVAFVAVFASYAVIAIYRYYNPLTFYDNGVSDEDYVAITNQTLEAKKFLEKYPESVIEVDRSGALAVDYRLDARGEYLRLRIFIDWRTNKTAEMFIDNSGTYIRENILEYLETVEFSN